jgi:hypothetical protein
MRIALVFALLATAMAARAWDDVGHMTVAAIAWDQLTPGARAQSVALLKLNPLYQEWHSLAGKNDADKTAFMMAAAWPDYIKHAAGYVDDGETPLGREAAANSGYGDKFMHKYWHYIDLPFSPDGASLVQPKTPNIETQIDAFRRVLAQPGGDAALKSYDLVWILHLVGDAHQPLHATSRFENEHPEGDAGGNRVKVCAESCSSLHAYWDGLLEPPGRHVDSQCKAHHWALDANQCISLKLAAALANAKTLKPAAGKLAGDLEEKHWIAESFALAKSRAYAAPVQVGNGPYVLDRAYETAAHRVGEDRVALAGARLANLLNHALH